MYKQFNKTNIMANYHISRHFLGKEAEFTPRIPVSFCETEQNMPPRVCAAPTVSQCWEAIRVCYDLMFAMKKNNTRGYYFFVYALEGDFVESGVIDSAKTCEVVSYKKAKGTFLYCFYVDSYRLLNCFENAAEQATTEEGISAYNEWQKNDITKIEYSL